MRIFNLPVLPLMMLVWSLSACSSGLLSVHKMDIQQGNALSEQSISQLRVGMRPPQVRFILGQPLITDPFHADHWYYVYYFEPGNGPLDKLSVTVVFDNGRVARIDKPVSHELVGISATHNSAVN